MIRYAYLWRIDAKQGLAEGKDRPAVIVAAMPRPDGRTMVSVVPITHSQPKDPTTGYPIPRQTAIRLRLDHDQSWIVTSEVNRFEWPGADLRPVSRDRWAYGLLPQAMQKSVQRQVRHNVERQQLRVTGRN